jgi:hypothetical protein
MITGPIDLPDLPIKLAERKKGLNYRNTHANILSLLVRLVNPSARWSLAQDFRKS